MGTALPGFGPARAGPAAAGPPPPGGSCAASIKPAGSKGAVQFCNSAQYEHDLGFILLISPRLDLERVEPSWDEGRQAGAVGGKLAQRGKALFK